MTEQAGFVVAKNKMRFTVGVLIILGSIVYFGITGFQEGKAYYKTIEEFHALGEEANDKRLRVAGIVSAGTIDREGTKIHFQLEQETLNLTVHYVGSGPVPDTFKDGAEAIVEGKRLPDGSFEADHIQAKCASKYEGKYGSTENSAEY